MAKDKWLIVNYFSGTSTENQIIKLKELLSSLKDIKIFETEFAKHGQILSQNAVSEEVERVIAVGGDGTINEIATELVGTNTSLGIVPKGSGNGLARHLGIPTNADSALKLAQNGKPKEIDFAKINGEISFFCTAGIGFDAAVALDFAHRKGRGLLNYVKASVSCFFTYKPLKLSIKTKSFAIEKEIFTLTFANAGQYGNNAWIAPEADISDGLLDLVILRPYPFWVAPIMVVRLFSKSLHNSKYIEIYKTKVVEITAANDLLIHYDGEPKQLNTNTLNVCIADKKLNVIY